MKAQRMTKQQLIDELTVLQERIADLEKETHQAKKEFGEKLCRYFPTAEHLNEAIYVLFDRKYEFVNEEFADIFGMTPEEICSAHFDPISLVAPESRTLVREKYRHRSGGNFRVQQFEFTGLTKDGFKIHCETFVLFIPYKWGVAIHGMLRNITVRKRIDQELQRPRNDLQIVLNSIPTSIFYTDRNHRFTQVNKAFCKSLGYPMDEIIGKTLVDLFPNLPPGQLSHFFEVGDQVMNTGLPIRGIIEAFPSIRGRRWIQNDRLPYRDDAGNIAGLICLTVDISDIKETEEKLWYLSFHDVLTGLYNRLYFEEEMVRLENSRQFPVSIVVIRIDDILSTNERCGIEAGNELLKRTSKILRNFRQEDVLARIGGDTFAALLPFSDQIIGEGALNRIKNALETHNRHHSNPALKLSFAVETGEKGCKLSDILKKAEAKIR